MMLRTRPLTEPFQHFLGQARAVLGLWARVVGGIVAATLVLGPFAPLGAVAILFTIGLPILLLVLWGRSLDSELGWTEIEQGPW